MSRHIGGSLDDFLAEEGLLEHATEVATPGSTLTTRPN